MFVRQTLLLTLLLLTTKDCVSDERIKQGKEIYARCSSCHSPASNRTGPKHCGILGRKAGSVANYDYSEAMALSALLWTKENLDQFILNPRVMVPGTTMAIVGIESDQDRALLIEYLASLTTENTKCQ